MRTSSRTHTPVRALLLTVLCALAACGGGDDPDTSPDAATSPDGASAACGNGVLDLGEPCDGAELDGETCATQGFAGGALACADDCAGFDTTGCVAPGCGNGIEEAGEDCDDGNDAPGDGCENDCTVTPAEVVCETLAPLASGVCEVAAGNAATLLRGDVLAPSQLYRGGQVLVNAAGTIVCTGCDCAADPAAAGATVVTCPQGVISPGLVNTHDHITFTNTPPYNDTGERYEHRHDWRRGLRGHTEINTLGTASGAQVQWGELRFLLGGATSTIGSGGQAGLLRNLDRSGLQEGLTQPLVDFDTFPLGDSSGTQLTSTCNYGTVVTPADIAGVDAYLPHVAEGIDAVSRNEFLCLSSASYDTASPGLSSDVTVAKSAFIHAVGLDVPDLAMMALDGTAIVWSPRSNITLYGDTAQVTLADALGVQLALGTDWLATGSMNLLRELQCADELNRDYYGGYFTDRELWRMVTGNAAAVAAVDDVIGALAPGKLADIAIFDGSVNAGYRAVIDGEPSDVALVLRGGVPLYGDAAVVNALAASCDTLDVCGVGKRVCVQDELGKSLAQLTTEAGAIYGAFFCGPPDNEPSCVPSRPDSVAGSTVYTGAITDTDPDGDGIVAGDNCPTVFNPVRPLDGGTQGDFDGDGEGDVCDVCPRDADTTTCTTINPDDADADGVLDSADNCPTDPNTDQLDTDVDGKGDACDACPEAANPGAAACPTTIYEIKGTGFADGDAVALTNALVTARATSGYFLQVHEDEAGYAGPDRSGVFVYAPGNTVAAGDRVTFASATVNDFFGQRQLTGPTGVTVVSSGNPLPAPIVETPANLATGGARAAVLEAVLVSVVDVAVIDAAPAAGPGDTAPINEFTVTGGLRVNDLLHLVTPFPAAGANFASLTGVLDFRNGNSKLEPRSAADIVVGAASLGAFAPGSAFAYVGQVGAPTVPTALTVTLAALSDTPAFVAVTSDDASIATIPGGGVTIPAGSLSATVPVTGLAAGTVTLTATLGASFTAQLRVLDPATLPTVTSLTPPSVTIAAGGTVGFTVGLDLPAPAGGATVAVALTPAGAGTVPATVTVPAGALSATFTYVDGGVASSIEVAATLGATISSTVTVAASTGGLVINELDVNQVGIDAASYVEVFNGTGADVALADLSLVLVNGSNGAEYLRVALGDAGATLPAGGYLVVRNSTVTVPVGTLVVDQAGDWIQNGSPDAALLLDTSANTVVDAMSYGGTMATGTLDGGAVVTLMAAGAGFAGADTADDVNSISRLPNGSDTDDSSVDFQLTANKTPGAAN